MTTVQEAQKTIECAVCESIVPEEKLTQQNISPKQNNTIKSWMTAGIFGELMGIAQYVYQNIDIKHTSSTLAIKETIQDALNTIDQKLHKIADNQSAIGEKIVGPGIGDVDELAIVEQLSQHSPPDGFDVTKADKAATDCTATVFEKAEELGKISISSKATESYSSSHETQILKNMEHDGADIGILVERKMPKGAKPTGKVVKSRGKMYVIVHLKYLLPVYAILRQLVIINSENKLQNASKEKEVEQMEKQFKQFAKWMRGQGYGKLIAEFDEIKSECDATRESLLQLQDYVVRKIKSACETQVKIHQHVLNGHNLLAELRKSLSESNGGKKN